MRLWSSSREVHQQATRASKGILTEPKPSILTQATRSHSLMIAVSCLSSSTLPWWAINHTHHAPSLHTYWLATTHSCTICHADLLLTWYPLAPSHLIAPVSNMTQAYENKLPRWPPRHDFCGAQCPLPHCTPLLSLFGTCSPKTGLTHTHTCKNPHRVDTSWSSGTGWSYTYDGQGVHSLLCVAISMSPTCSSRELMQPSLAFGATWQHPNTL